MASTASYVEPTASRARRAQLARRYRPAPTHVPTDALHRSEYYLLDADLAAAQAAPGAGW